MMNEHIFERFLESYSFSAAFGQFVTGVLALALIGVGFTIVRKAHNTAGILVGVAGLLKMLFNCCCGFAGFAVTTQAYDMGDGRDSVMLMIYNFVASLGGRIPVVLLLVAVVLLAKKATSTTDAQS